MSVTVTIQGQDRLIDALDRVGLTFKDLRPVFISASKLIYEFEKEAFASEGRSSAVGQWAPLTRNYARWKAVNAPGKPILQLTGALKDSLTRPNARGSRRSITETELIVGTGISCARFHQEGTREMVARPPLALTEAQEKQVAKLLRVGLAEFVKRAGFVTFVEVGE